MIRILYFLPGTSHHGHGRFHRQENADALINRLRTEDPAVDIEVRSPATNDKWVTVS